MHFHAHTHTHTGYYYTYSLGVGHVHALLAKSEGVLSLSDANPLAVLELAVGLVVAEPLTDLSRMCMCVCVSSFRIILDWYDSMKKVYACVCI
jgi:hypothetical protein